MKICYIGDPNSLNIKIFIEYFSKKGHEVHTFGWSPYQFEKNENIIHHQFVKSKKMSGKNKKDIKIIEKETNISKGKKSPIAKGLFDLYEIIKIRHMVDRIKPDLVHGNEASGNGYTTSILKKYPRILTCWGSDINKFPKESRWISFKVDHALNHVDIVHVTNEEFGNTIIKDFKIDPSKIRNIPWGIEIDRFDPERLEREKVEELRKYLGIHEGEIVITYPAGFRDKKLQNYVNLVKAFAQLCKSYNNLKLILLAYNRRSGMDEVKEILNENDLWSSVRIIDDYLPYDKMPYLFHITDIMTLLHDVDQMSVSISESMYAGCINLFSSIEPYKKAFREGEHCIFTDQKDPDDIRKKLSLMIDNLEEYQRTFVNNNRKRIRLNFSREVQMRKIEEMYRSILK